MRHLMATVWNAPQNLNFLVLDQGTIPLSGTPKLMQPRHSLETSSPVFPSLTSSISYTSLFRLFILHDSVGLPWCARPHQFHLPPGMYSQSGRLTTFLVLPFLSAPPWPVQADRIGVELNGTPEGRTAWIQHRPLHCFTYLEMEKYDMVYSGMINFRAEMRGDL